MIYLSADVGGTFTDLVLIDSIRGRTLVEKLPSGRRGSADSIATGIERITAAAKLSAGDLDLFVHGFTVATNAFLMRQGARAALLVTAGFRDILEIGSQQRPRLYPLRQQKPSPLVPRARVVEVAERLDAFGDVVEPLLEEEITRVIAEVAALEPEAVAICLNFSFLDDRHERRLADAFEAAFPGLPLYLSSTVNPQIEEYPRANTTALAAYVGLVVDRYLGDVEAKLGAVGARCPLRLMRSDGGVATPRAARANPAHMMLSGPAAGVIAGRELGQRLGRRDLVTFDMGGTSADFSVIAEGEPRTVRERAIGGQPLRLPSLDIETISAGGGSIAWVDRAGALKVGPDSAGALPGPACYGQGGGQPTVTDAAVLLGLLDPARYLGGRVKLDAALAAAAIDEMVARPLGLGREEAAAGIIAIANVQMAQAIRTISVERGLDVRCFSLLALGGAGPLFAPYLAAGLDMAEVLVPRHPGVFCAEGLLMSDIRHVVQTVHRRALAGLDSGELAAKAGTLKDQLEAALAADGIEPAARRYRLSGDLRYLGQFHELELLLPLPGESEWWDSASITGRFHDAHRTAYGHAEAEAPIELVNLRLTGLGRIDRPPAEPEEAAKPYEPAALGEHPVYLDRRTGFIACRHYDRADFAPGARVRGPALIHQLDTTVLVMPGHAAETLAGGVLAITGMNGEAS
ncbi:MAG TPA: hydantoinase/oxoprolinase family protein [Dongiaceae bacterium]|nr:hydantoinase/oxoprolinase family protein [Dongiaceae bacterium]